MSGWGGCDWVSGYLGDLRLVTGCFMGFWVGCMSVEPLQGDSWVFGYYGGLFRGLIKGLTGSLYYFSDSNDICWSEYVIYVI